ncbi:hypothetical protein JCM33374_g6185 [Metschnikowia sp. JCM 33374]|nr:hypothetical protein JCM33374_g6185 [Metschnikowia sp. JCM 33374]
MSPSTSEESSAQVQSGSIESNWPSPPGFFLHLFNRKVIDTSLPIQDQQVTLTCKAPGCDKSYKQPYPGNTPALLQHYKANHRHLLVQVATDAINSGQPREETILGTNVLDGLTDLPPEVTHYFSAAKTTSRRKLKPRYANCTPNYFRKIFTQWLIGLNIPFETCDDYLTKRMLDGARFGLSQVVSRGQCMLELKKMYFRKTRQLKKQLAEHDGRVALTIYEWNASNQNDGRFLGITLHFLDKSFQPKSYTIGPRAHAQESSNGPVAKPCNSQGP